MRRRGRTGYPLSVVNWDLNGFLRGFATPYLLAALGLMINERAGVLNLGCEGMMLVGAMTGAAVSFHTGLAGAGVPVAMLAGALVAWSSASPWSSSAPIRC